MKNLLRKESSLKKLISDRNSITGILKYINEAISTMGFFVDQEKRKIIDKNLTEKSILLFGAELIAAFDENLIDPENPSITAQLKNLWQAIQSKKLLKLIDVHKENYNKIIGKINEFQEVTQLTTEILKSFKEIWEAIDYWEKAIKNELKETLLAEYLRHYSIYHFLNDETIKTLTLFDGIQDGIDCAQFDSWYHPDICQLLIEQASNHYETPCVQFHDGGDVDNLFNFIIQVQAAKRLSEKIKKPIAFLAKKPGGYAHFIAGFVQENLLFIFDPLGYSTDLIMQFVVKNLNQKGMTVVASNNILQKNKFEKYLVSCGPLSVLFITECLLKNFKIANLQTNLPFQILHLDLPESLQAIENANDALTYCSLILDIRAKHRIQIIEARQVSKNVGSLQSQFTKIVFQATSPVLHPIPFSESEPLDQKQAMSLNSHVFWGNLPLDMQNEIFTHLIGDGDWKAYLSSRAVSKTWYKCLNKKHFPNILRCFIQYSNDISSDLQSASGLVNEERKDNIIGTRKIVNAFLYDILFHFFDNNNEYTAMQYVFDNIHMITPTIKKSNTQKEVILLGSELICMSTDIFLTLAELLSIKNILKLIIINNQTPTAKLYWKLYFLSFMHSQKKIPSELYAFNFPVSDVIYCNTNLEQIEKIYREPEPLSFYFHSILHGNLILMKQAFEKEIKNSQIADDFLNFLKIQSKKCRAPSATTIDNEVLLLFKAQLNSLSNNLFDRFVSSAIWNEGSQNRININVLRVIPETERVTFVKKHVHKINIWLDLIDILKVIPGNERLDLVTKCWSKIMRETFAKNHESNEHEFNFQIGSNIVVKIFEQLPPSDALIFLETRATKIKENVFFEVVSVIVKAIPESTRLSFIRKYPYSIRNGFHIAEIYKQLSPSDALVFLKEHTTDCWPNNKITSAKQLATVLGVIPEDMRKTFAYAKRYKIINCQHLILICKLLPPSDVITFIKEVGGNVAISGVIKNKDDLATVLSAVSEVIPKDERLSYARGMKNKFAREDKKKIKDDYEDVDIKLMPDIYKQPELKDNTLYIDIKDDIIWYTARGMGWVDEITQDECPFTISKDLLDLQNIEFKNQILKITSERGHFPCRPSVMGVAKVWGEVCKKDPSLAFVSSFFSAVTGPYYNLGKGIVDFVTKSQSDPKDDLDDWFDTYKKPK